jgi:uncharacterized protein YgfB (UPF0149 family)
VGEKSETVAHWVTAFAAGFGITQAIAQSSMGQAKFGFHELAKLHLTP